MKQNLYFSVQLVNNQNLKPMNKSLKKAIYIHAICMQVNKPLCYALDIVCWYSMTDNEDNEIKQHLVKLFNNN